MVHITSAIILLSLFSVAYSSYVQANNGGPWGDWGPVELCPPGYTVQGVSIKVEQPLGSSEDDTAVNGIRFHCFDNNNREATIQSTVAQWGSWGSMVKCNSGYVVSFQIKVEPNQFVGDDTALNNIKIQCSNGEQLEPKGDPWGSYSLWSGKCNSGGCGIQTKVEKPQAFGDDTAVNDVRMFCCN
ncbi:vitelline membrane outer layer protein 1 homolog [Mixophyes fleayi]|uniref:vitelline membrane outer layer protein 1 homolog n=1 Tax=Mixophyes fleayi TaxID=3061075 RepID=UPI003F4E2045